MEFAKFEIGRVPHRSSLSGSDGHVFDCSLGHRGHRSLLSINESIYKFISHHSTEARATMRLCRIKEKCLKADLKCVNGWSSLTVQWKRVPESRSSNRETTCSSVQVVRRNWQKLLCGWSQQARLTVWADQISEVAWLLKQVTKFGEFEGSVSGPANGPLSALLWYS